MHEFHPHFPGRTGFGRIRHMDTPLAETKQMLAPTWRKLLPRFSRRDVPEAAIISFAFLLYFWVRGAVVDRPEAAYWHARHIIDIQRSLHFFWEPDLNSWVA